MGKICELKSWELLKSITLKFMSIMASPLATPGPISVCCLPGILMTMNYDNGNSVKHL